MLRSFTSCECSTGGHLLFFSSLRDTARAVLLPNYDDFGGPMAGERKGITYEAIVKIALEELIRSRKLKGHIFWNERPEGMTIDPDFTVGPNAGDPKILFLINHSSAAGNSHMKFWRNVGELVEAKVWLARPPIVYCITFDSVVKNDLKAIQSASFDGTLIVSDRPYGRELLQWVEDHQEQLPKAGAAKVVKIRDWISRKSVQSPDRIVKQFVRDLATLVQTEQIALRQLWHTERQRPVGRAPIAKHTFVRRGIGKLLIFDDLELALRLYSPRGAPVGSVPLYVFELDLASRSISGAKGSDPEIRDVLARFDTATIRKLVKDVPRETIGGWLGAIRSLENLPVMSEFVLKNLDALRKPAALFKMLKNLRQNPLALVAPAGRTKSWPPPTVWLLEYLVELLRVVSGSRTGYGYAALGADAQRVMKTRLKDRTIWIVLTDWIHRRGAEILDDKVLYGISGALAERLKTLGPDAVRDASATMLMQYRNGIIETKLLTYRGLDPIRSLLISSGMAAVEVWLRSCFAEAANLSGQAGRTRLLQVRHTIINWQSATDAGRGHKRKELCGRAVAIRYSWDGPRAQFRPRPGIAKLILVVDGTWDQSDLDSLVKAGWDEIYYPDEIDKLVKAIV